MAESDDVVQGRVQLRRRSLMRIPDARGTRLDVRHGRVWITEAGDPRDYFLGAGEQFQFTGPGTALVSALEASVVLLASSPASRLAERIGLIRAGTDIIEPLAPSPRSI